MIYSHYNKTSFRTVSMHQVFLTTIVFLLVSLVLTHRAKGQGDPPPNIIVFYVDDLGWQDVELNDLDDPCPYETPNIIQMAANGMNFTQAYSPAPTCSPSRAAINSGQHPAKTRFTHVTLDDKDDGNASELLFAPYLQLQMDRNLLTSADVLKANGYRTGHSGKWHIGLNASNYGFETVNHSRGVHRSMSPDRVSDFATATDPNYPLSVEKYPPLSVKNPTGISYPYDEVTESALQFIDDNKSEPFFLNLCHWMVHWPVLTRNEALLEHYCDKFGHAFPPSPGDWTTPGQTNPYFAAMVTTVDWSLGRIVEYLEDTDDPRSPGKKLSETTYIFFSSDNGGAEQRRDEVISENAPLKGKKGYVAEGGIRVPLVVTGPNITPASEFDTMVNQLDFFPTFLTLTDATMAPADFEKLSGVDLAPVLQGASTQVLDSAGQERDFLFWHFPHYSTMSAAVRSGDYKLHKSLETNVYELYRLYDANGDRLDIEEAIDLAGDPTYASTVAQLSGMLNGALADNNAELPYLNPNYSGRTLPVTEVDTNIFQSATREAQLSVLTSSPKIQEAYVIYCGPEQNLSDDELASSPYIAGMREPAVVSVDGYSVTANIPTSIDCYALMLIDENGFMQYTTEVSSPYVQLPGLVAYWSLNELSGSQAEDSSIHDFEASVTGAEWHPGVDNNGLHFDGMNDVAAIPAAAVSSIDSEISIAFWAYGGASQPAQDTVFYASDGTNTKLLNIHLPWSNSKVFWDAGGDRVSQTVTGDTIKGKWNHWVFTKDTSGTGSMKIYLNGAISLTETGHTGSMSGITQAWFGGSNGNGAASYDGYLDEVRLYNIALTDSDITSLYNGYELPVDYDEWLLNFPPLTDTDFIADPEKDGIANGIEYVLGSAPSAPDTVFLPEMNKVGTDYVYTFTRQMATVPFTKQYLQYGSDLDGWTDLNITEPRASEVTLGNVVNGEQDVSVALPQTTAVNGRMFFRLKVTQAELDD